ncbi:DNA helicase [Tanacetum coccineum]
MCAAVKAIGSFDLVLPSGLMIVLDNCHFSPTITRVVVPISRLVDNSYIHTFTNYGNSVSKDNMFYFNAIPHDGLYEIDMHNLYPNVSSTYNVSNKRAKHGLDSEYLWHCRLGHINKKFMEKLQRDGILQPTHDESLDKCKSCISRKMAPVMVMFNLMKHKHELFETFKVFQNEVENQLDKKIKAIQSNQGGGYLSHEFVNHMKSYGIVSQVTPPYTPQHNGVSERMNQTLLNMVRSMMNLTTLQKYFWVYALESAARILNMVPTKKFERTLYEIWHGKAPKLSYLRVWGCVALFFENSLTLQEASGSHGLLEMSESDVGLELIQEDDTKPSDNTRKKHNEVEPTEIEPHSAKIPIHRSERISQAPDRYGFYVDVEEHELGDLDEPPNYKDALSDPESDKWLDVMNTKMQSIKDNQNKRFYEEIKKVGFTQNPDKPCVYLKASGSNVAFLVLYVDDILIMRNNVTMLQDVKFWLFDFSIILGKFTRLLLKLFDDTKSQLGYVFVLNGGVVDWKSAKQSTIAMSSTEAEYIAAAKASMEAVWMRKFIDGLGDVMPLNKRPMEMLCDNASAIAIANDSGIMKGAKHYQRKYHYIREVIEVGEIVLKKVYIYYNLCRSVMYC